MGGRKGIRMWKPAWSVPRYLPSRSTTNADCCGTTTAVRAMTTTTRPASTSITRSAPVIVSPPSFGPHVEHEPLDALDAAAPPARERLRPVVSHRPCRAAQLGLAHGPGRQVVEQDGDVADEAAAHHAVAGRPQPLHEPAPAQDQRAHREQREEQTLNPRGARPPPPRGAA